MARNIQLLKQVRKVTTAIAAATENAEHKSLLSVVDLYLNELMLQDSSAFGVEFLSQGRALLAEGAKLAAAVGAAPPSAPAALRTDLDSTARIEVIDAQIDLLFGCLLDVVKRLDESRSPAEKDYLVRLSQWESRLYTHHLQQVELAPEDEWKPITPAAVQCYLEQKFPDWKDLKLTQFRSLEGGISKETILFETQDRVNGHQSLVIRAEKPMKLLHIDGSDVAREFYMFRLMRKLGMPTADALWLEEDRSHLGTRFIVSRKARGRTVGGSLGSSQAPSEQLLESIMSTLFQMHRITLDPADPLLQKSHMAEWMPHKTIRDVARYNVEEFLPKMIRHAGIKMSPQLMRALRWLQKNVPDVDERPVIVHIDYAYNNILVDEDRVSAVLDWETSRLGDPADDLFWTQQNLGVYSLPEFLRRYREGTGREVSEYRIAYARLAKGVFNLINCGCASRSLDSNDNAPLLLGVAAFKYLPLFGSDIDDLITAAEGAKSR
jgi:aminoglycoside phosphotransferase (APT) family kinase protein